MHYGLTEAKTGAILGTDSTWEDLLTFRTEEVINTEYALTCYVNDINREYTEVLTEYTVNGSKTDNIFSSITGTEEIQVLTDYVYGNQRIYGTGETTADTVEDSMAYHLNKHGNGRTIEQYTDDAMTFYEENKHLGVEVILKDGTEAIRIQTGTGKNKVGGYWTIDGKLVTFWD